MNFQRTIITFISFLAMSITFLGEHTQRDGEDTGEKVLSPSSTVKDLRQCEVIGRAVTFAPTSVVGQRKSDLQPAH